ncbi:hypothetical protein T492DRAFT_940591, partial [Pavlovales sp. CCMP2436]
HHSITRLARVLKWMALLRAAAGRTRRRRSRLPRLRRRCCSLRPPRQGCGGRDAAEAGQAQPQAQNSPFAAKKLYIFLPSPEDTLG